MSTALKDGVLTPQARNKIINALATLIMLYTTHPSAKKLSRVAERLVSQYPCLCDSVGSGYVSVYNFE